jgi:hypothetical protein
MSKVSCANKLTFQTINPLFFKTPLVTDNNPAAF